METRLRNRLIQETTEIIDGVSDRATHFVDVLFGYRLFLQRYPEFDDEASYSVRAGIDDLKAMARRFLRSPEFKKLWASELGSIHALLPDIVVMAEVGQFRIYFKLRDAMSGHQVAEGKYEPSTQTIIRQSVKPGMNCIDLGANIGYLSILMASATGESGSVHSFEPFPEMCEILNRNVDANAMRGIIRTYPIAAHSRAGTAPIYFRTDEANDNFGSNFIANVPDEVHNGTHKSVDIQLARVDDVIGEQLPIHFVKIDVEGSEFFALDGMQKILRRWHPLLIVELNEYCLRRMGGVTPDDLLAVLESYGYRVYALDNYLAGDTTPYRLDPQRKTFAFDNLVCV